MNVNYGIYYVTYLLFWFFIFKVKIYLTFFFLIKKVKKLINIIIKFKMYNCLTKVV